MKMNLFWKWIKNIILTVVAIVLVMLAFLQTGFFKNILRKILIAQANVILVDAKLEIKKMEGNFFSNIILKDVSITIDSKSVISFKELKIRYKLVPLFAKKIVIEQIFVDKPVLNLQQYENEKWNFISMFPIPKQDEFSNTEKKTNPFLWQIFLREFSLSDAVIAIQMMEKNPFIPEQIENINLNFSAIYTDKDAQFQLKHFNFHTQNPILTLNQLHFRVDMKNDIATLSDFELKTNENTFYLNAEFDKNEQKSSTFDFAVESLKLDEFVAFLPKLSIRKLPVINFNAALKEQIIEFHISLLDENQTIQIDLTADSIFSNLQYMGKIIVTNLNMSDWLDNENLDSNLNLELIFNGVGTNPKLANINLEILLHQSRIQDKTFNSLRLLLEKHESKLKFETNLNGEFGTIAFHGKADNIFSEINYNFITNIEHFNLAHLIANDSLQTDINLSIATIGTGIKPTTMQAKIELQATSSSFQSIDIDTLDFIVTYDKQKLQIIDFVLSNSMIDVFLSGIGELEGESEIEYALHIKQLEPLKKIFEIENIEATGGINGTVKGKVDAFSTTANIQISDFMFDNISLKNTNGTIQFEKFERNINADINFLLQEINYQNFFIDEVHVNISGTDKRFENRIFAQADSNSFLLNNWVELDSVITIGIKEIDVKTGTINVHTEHENSIIQLSKNHYMVKDLHLKSEDASLFLNGFMIPETEQDIHLAIENCDVSLLHNFIKLPIELQGNLTFDALVKGSSDKPVAQLNLMIDNIKINENAFELMTMKADIHEEKLKANIEIIRNPKEIITGSANLPFHLSKKTNIVPKSEQVEIDFMMKDLDISFLREFTENIDKLYGILDIEFALRNTFEQPELSGDVKFTNGSLNIQELGLQYSNVRFHVLSKNRKISLEELYLKAGNGFLKMEGFAHLEKQLSDGIKEFKFNISARDFQAANKRELEVLTNLDLSLLGTTMNPSFNGKLSITRARIDLDALQVNQKRKVDANEPLLMQALKKGEIQPNQKPIMNLNKSDLIDNLTGKMQISIPRNTWVKNKDMNVEIGGELDVVKTGKNFELFGFLNLIRGSYTLYGRKFDVRNGTVTFQGGLDFNPLLDVSIHHIFRDMNKHRRELEIFLSGNVMQPGITFFIDSTEITETDAISYLLFGKSSEQISQGERSEVAGQSEGSLAKSMIARQIGGQIASEIGRTLKLDVIEFSGGSDWKNASILFGKYITHNLFLSYQRELSLSQSKEFVPDRISLEYEINKFLSLQATQGDEKSTGIDFFWKYRKK
jgi:translocation and assembly module TamB